MPTLHWCKNQNNWFRSRCPDRDDNPGIQWTTFVNDECYNAHSDLSECECAIKERLARKPVDRRLP